ncbi:ARF GTPase-activating protein GIT2 isoform X2 [Ischnura elegans]|uniref:ARF GTPase-activating protein GIT2 isoform X2 n=1 Tax=Ischnura elegans TaxID=197161 RepID=UPI001ED8B7B8|nr:ARF GTPase-activating protein GIT2 isoform X2 [Ischnura elegans]
MTSQMSRSKSRSANDYCADCGSLDPNWASINRGILICDDCCSIHRSLGRHISQVKSLKKGTWSPTLLAMVHTLNTCGANNIWEHSLLDPSNAKSGRRKPQPKDPTLPTKADFVRAKHQTLAFLYRPNAHDGNVGSGESPSVLYGGTVGDLSQQLHASVRTGNLETSLRLLSLGADPNYFHEVKGNTPLHVAAASGQASQVELLVVYGADPGAPDYNGRTPIDYAWSSNHKDLADRLTELMYELSDRLAYFVCARKPDHQNGQHFIIPEMSDSLEMTEFAKAAKKKLQSLPNHLFEELAMDVFDEVDRRETEAAWNATHQQQPGPGGRIESVDRWAPFLPVNTELSAPRNQGRQKLALFNAREFTTLVIDVLSDAKRRQGLASSSVSMVILPRESREISSKHTSLNQSSKHKSSASDDEPLYDSVASDEDYIVLEQQQILAQQHIDRVYDGSGNMVGYSSLIKGNQSENGGDKVDSVNTVENASNHKANDEIGVSHTGSGCSIGERIVSEVKRHVDAANGIASMENYFKKQLAVSEAQMDELKHEIRMLQMTVQSLSQENSQLKVLLHKAGIDSPSTSVQSVPIDSLSNGQEMDRAGYITSNISSNRSPRMSQQRPASMYETRERLAWGAQNSHHINSSVPSNQPLDSSGGEYDSCSSHQHNHTRSPMPWSSPLHSRGNVGIHNGSMPPAEEVRRKTDHITKRIQELWSSMQEERQEAFVPCADGVRNAVAELSAIFPKNPLDKQVRYVLKQLQDDSCRLQNECACLQSAYESPANSLSEGSLSPGLSSPSSTTSEGIILGSKEGSCLDRAQCLQQVRSCAYDIAKATKALVTKFHF